MDVSQEIAKRVGKKGPELRRFSGTLDSLSASQMIEAIEEECERVDTGEW